MPKQWDYSIVQVPGARVTTLLSEMGAQGWELVQISMVAGEIGVMVKERIERFEAIFKREKLTYLPNPYDTSKQT